MVTRLLTLMLLSLVISACALKPPPVERTETYHRPAKPAKPPASRSAVDTLRRKAIQLINAERYDDAIGYLQRAIKIDPRDARSWHYLAQTYWHMQDYPQCRAMVRRAMSYSQQDEDLQKANRTLLQQCFE